MTEPKQDRRIIGLDAHPYLFSAAALTGPDAREAQVAWCVDRVGLTRLEPVLRKHMRPGDIVVLEASGNSFALAFRLALLGLEVRVLESQSVGRVGKTYCATDKTDAVKIARVYMSGLAREVWIPDADAAARRELFFAHRNAVRDSVRARNRLWAFLNQWCVKQPRGLRLSAPSALEHLLALREWTQMQQMILGELVEAFEEADARRRRLRARIAAEVASDPGTIKLIGLLGIRDKVAFALAAFIGTIERFESPRKLVAYFGLNPSVSRSGIGGGNGPMGVNGRSDVRALLIQAAQSILRYGQGPTHRWALALKMRKGTNVAVAALARKLVVSVWYLMKGYFTPLTEITAQVRTKIHKIAAEIGSASLKQMGYASLKDFEEEKLTLLCPTT